MTKYGLNLAFASRPRPLCYVALDLEEETQETELWTDDKSLQLEMNGSPIQVCLV